MPASNDCDWAGLAIRIATDTSRATRATFMSTSGCLRFRPRDLDRSRPPGLRIGADAALFADHLEPRRRDSNQDVVVTCVLILVERGPIGLPVGSFLLRIGRDERRAD